MRRILAAVLLVCLLAWAGAYSALPPAELNVWIVRDQLILLTGLSAYAVMTLIMLLAVRPMWLETRLGGLDKMYRLHKWSGILATALAAALDDLAASPQRRARMGRDGRLLAEERHSWNRVVTRILGLAGVAEGGVR